MKLGNLVQSAGLTKSNLMQALHLGLGAALFPFAYGALQGQLLLKASPSMFAQNSPGEYAARILTGVAGGALIYKKAGSFKMAGLGWAGMAVGSVLKDVLAGFMSPAAAAQQAAVKAEETATGQSQQSATSPLGRGLAGLGYGNYGGRGESSLYGVGTPDLSGAGMLGAATVAIESPGFSGATVSIETPSFAGSLQ